VRSCGGLKDKAKEKETRDIMALYHMHCKVIQRSKGKSAIAAAAYRSGSSIESDYDGTTYSYIKKTGVVMSEIIAPDGAPSWITDRAALWNAIEAAEKRKDAQLAREVELALPIELDAMTQRELVREFVTSEFVSHGMVADLNYHDKDGTNPHVHIMLSTRELTSEGFGKKNRDWNSKELYRDWRKKWEEIVNRSLEKAGIEDRVSCESYEARGIDVESQIHIGVHAAAMEAKGIETERGDINRGIAARNAVKEIARLEVERREAEVREAETRWQKAAEPRLESFTKISRSVEVPVEIPGFRLHIAEGGERRYSKESRADRRDGGGEVSFVDQGDAVKVLAPKDDEVIEAALRLAAQKWGVVHVNGGDDDYRQRCVVLAAKHDIDIGNPELQGALRAEQARLEAEAENQRRVAEVALPQLEPEKPKESERDVEIRRLAGKIAAVQKDLQKQHEAAVVELKKLQEAEPRGLLELLGESKKHKEWRESYESAEAMETERGKAQLKEERARLDAAHRRRAAEEAGAPVEIPGFLLHVAGDERRYSKEDQAKRRGSGEIAFIDRGPAVVVLAPRDDDVILAALRLAAQKWGAIKISGGDEDYQRRCVALAVENDIEIGNPELQGLVKELEATQQPELSPREKKIRELADEIAAEQRALRKDYDTARAAAEELQKAEPRKGFLRESPEHRQWREDMGTMREDLYARWKACGGDMDAPDHGEAEANRRLTPEYAREMAKKQVETEEREARQKERIAENRRQVASRDTVKLKAGEKVICHTIETLLDKPTSFPAEIVAITDESIELRAGGRDLVVRREKCYFTEPEVQQVRRPEVDDEAIRKEVLRRLERQERRRDNDRGR
jgi:hypothetical protein